MHQSIKLNNWYLIAWHIIIQLLLSCSCMISLSLSLSLSRSHWKNCIYRTIELHSTLPVFPDKIAIWQSPPDVCKDGWAKEIHRICDGRRHSRNGNDCFWSCKFRQLLFINNTVFIISSARLAKLMIFGLIYAWALVHGLKFMHA